MMLIKDVFEIIELFKRNNIYIWLDGGWGVDALLEKQTRDHEDLDIAIQKKDVPRLLKLLESEGYQDVPRSDTVPWNFVLGDDKGHLIDVHVIVFDKKGNGLYGPEKEGVMYPAASLTGQGKIKGIKVNCISSEYVIKFHCQYKPNENDFRDISAICSKFKIQLPKEYKGFI